MKPLNFLKDANLLMSCISENNSTVVSGPIPGIERSSLAGFFVSGFPLQPSNFY
jgi:hypothetical protein